jgi:DNA-binding winged helix-turn-helix (wHTH) protein
LSPPTRYRFDDCEIDLDARELRRAGQPVDVEAKVFDLIALLLHARDRALSKNDLNRALWGDRPVTDAALSQQLRKARRALGDDGDAQRVIRTVHGRGLRWVAEVSPVVAEATAEPALPAPSIAVAPALSIPPSRTRRRWLAVAAATVLLLIAASSAMRFRIRAAGDPTLPARIAVLPLVDHTGEPELAWTRTGLMGLMSSLFDQRDRVEVISAQNVQAVAAKGEVGAAELETLRGALGATHFIAAELRRVGPLYELDLRLIAAGAAERHEVLHGSTPAPLAVDAVARVRRWLDLTPLPDIRTSGIVSPFLAEVYARGLDAQLHGDHAGARKYFEICLDHDPGLAWPRLGLAISQSASGEDAESDINATRVAAAVREHGDRELLVPALRQLASVAFHRGDLTAATAYLDEAMLQLPAAHNPLALTDLLIAYASIEDERGEFAQSREHYDQALKLARATGNRRGQASALVNLASIENGAGDAAAAGKLLRDGLDAARESGDAYLEGSTLGNLGATEANQGRLLAAIALFKQGLKIARERGDTHLQAMIGTQLVWTLAPFGHDAEARALARQVVSLGEAAANPYWQAEAHWALAALDARRRDWPQAFRELERARDAYAADGMTRSLAPLLAEIVATASDAGDLARAQEAAAAFRAIAAADAASWQAWLPLIEAQLRKAGGDTAGAADALARSLDAAPNARGAAAQAALFQLGRWQVELGRPRDLLARTEWKPWLEQHPDAIGLRISALRADGQAEAADAEQARLDRMRHAPELDLDPAWLAAAQ